MIDPFSNLHPVVADLLRRGMADARSGRTAYARREFEQALALDPECVEAMLWLAALAPDGETSLRYLSHALEINPREPRAHAGIRWARKRLAQPPRAEPPNQSAPVARVLEQTQPAPRVEARPRRLGRWQFVLVALVTACIVIAGGLFVLDSPAGDRVLMALALMTPTPTPTSTFTASPTPSPTHPPTWTSTASATVTETPAPSDTPSPTPTDTPTPLPTAAPYVPPPPTATLPPVSGDTSARWIDVNLSAQTAVAYEGNSPVRYFVVSTGLWNTPTVTGQFSIYLRYDSQTMSGPGYYLPGVQWVQYFYQDYALHGTYWHNNFGQPMSHGCINLTNADAAWLWTWADYGTLVNIHY